MDSKLIVIVFLIGVISISGCIQQEGIKTTTTLPEGTTTTEITTTTQPTTTTQEMTTTQQTTTTIEETTTTSTTTTIEALTVSRVIDGDTVDLSDGERVRLLSINTPESGQKCYSEATDRLKQLVLGKEITLEKDVTDEDIYGRLLRYIYVDGSFVNLILVQEGYANAYIVSPDTKYESQIEEAEALAQQQEEGCLWQPSVDYSDCFSVVTFHYDAEGNDNYNLNDEYATLKNGCGFSIDMTSWTIKDEATHIYTFSAFTIESQASFTLYSGTGTDTATELYWGRSYGAVWNNDGDTLYLRDSEGNLVLSYSY